MSIVDRIKQCLDAMTKSERRVASFSLGHLNDIAFYTLDKLAAEIGTSTTSVLRFCRRLGFSGYKDFQEVLRADLKYQPDLTDKFQRTLDSSHHDALLSGTVQQNILCIQQTFGDLPYDQICQAVKLIAQAKRVYTFGMRESGAMAHYAYSRFMTVRPDVYLLSAGYHGDVESLLSLTPEDVCVVYLFHRYTRQSLQILELLKQQGIPVILVTSPPFEEVENLAAVLLSCQVDINGIKNSFAAPVCLADYLCNAVAVTGGQQSLEHMKKTEALFRSNSVLGS